MISTADFRNGIVIDYKDQLMELVEFQHVKPGKGPAFVRTKLKNVLTGRVLENTFRSGERMEEVRLVEEKYQYLYTDGDLFHFMNNETYEQIEVSKDVLGDKAQWLKENTDVGLLFHGTNPISVSLPNTIELLITQCDPGLQGDRSSGGTKPATLETGVTVQVPLFVNEGESIKVDTRTGDYLERVSS
jgi:elongation factor P